MIPRKQKLKYFVNKVLTHIFSLRTIILIELTVMPGFLQHSQLQRLQLLRPVSYVFLYNFASAVSFGHQEILRTDVIELDI